MRKLLLSAHRWTGLLIGILFAFIMLSGVVLTVTEQVQERVIIDRPWKQQSVQEMGQDLAYLLSDQPSQLHGTIYMPTPLQPAYGIPFPIYSAEEADRMRGIGDRVRTPVTNYYGLDDFELIWSFDRNAEPGWRINLERWHINLVSGTWITAWVGYAGAVLALIGIYLWIPWRRGFRWLRGLAPANGSRSQLLNHHAAGGILSVIFVFVLALSGALLAQRGPVLDIVGQLEGGRADQANVPSLLWQQGEWASWPDMLTTAHQEMPGAVLASVSIPLGSQALDFRFRSKADISQFGSSHVYLNPWTGQVLSSYRVEEQSGWRWTFSQLRPIHTGENMPHWYVLVLSIGSLIGGLIALTGVISMVRSLLAKVDAKTPTTAPV